MGKHRRQRQKFHLPAKTKVEVKKEAPDPMDTSKPLMIDPPENLFTGININLDGLKRELPDDTHSVKSFKSLKSEVGDSKALSKKDKLKLRRETLLKKIDTVNQMKLESKRRKKRKNMLIIGDTNALHDALPSLESLLASRSKDANKRTENQTKPKGTEKASKRKKQTVEGVRMLKKLMASKQFQKHPFKLVSQQVNIFVDRSKKN